MKSRCCYGFTSAHCGYVCARGLRLLCLNFGIKSIATSTLFSLTRNRIDTLPSATSYAALKGSDQSPVKPGQSRYASSQYPSKFVPFGSLSQHSYNWTRYGTCSTHNRSITVAPGSVFKSDDGRLLLTQAHCAKGRGLFIWTSSTSLVMQSSQTRIPA